MVEVRWTEEAERWLRDIHDYIALDNPFAAKKVISGIFEKAQILTEFPEIGHKYRDEKEGEIRILLYVSGHSAPPLPLTELLIPSFTKPHDV